MVPDYGNSTKNPMDRRASQSLSGLQSMGLQRSWTLLNKDTSVWLCGQTVSSIPSLVHVTQVP